MSHSDGNAQDPFTFFGLFRTTKTLRKMTIFNTFYIITEGEAEVVRTGADGCETVLATLSDGAFFGETEEGEVVFARIPEFDLKQPQWV